MKKLFLAIFIVILLSALAGSINVRSVSAGTAGEQFNAGLGATAGKMGYDNVNPGSSGTVLNQKIGRIVQAVLASVGVVFLILAIYGGYTWMLSRGNEQQATKAKNILVNAIIGLLIVLSAYAITTMMVHFWRQAADTA